MFEADCFAPRWPALIFGHGGGEGAARSAHSWIRHCAHSNHNWLRQHSYITRYHNWTTLLLFMNCRRRLKLLPSVHGKISNKHQFLGSLIINGNGVCASVVAYKSTCGSKPVGLVQKSAVACTLFCIHHMNRVNSRNGSAMMTAP